jgi:hypothetical protein
VDVGGLKPGTGPVLDNDAVISAAFCLAKEDYGLGTGHARAIAYVIQHGPEFELRHITGTHRDASGTLELDGMKQRKNKKAKTNGL